MTKSYIRWTEEDIVGLRDLEGMTALFTEVNEQGFVLREIGIDDDGTVVHKCPADGFKYGTYGLFDNQLISLSDRSENVPKDRFEQLWNAK